MIRHLAAAAGAALSAAVAGADEAWELSTDCEQALALAAGPTSLRDGAGVYVLSEHGYELRRESANGFVCLVQRDSAHSLIPQCFDRTGWDAHVAVVRDGGEKLRAGMSWADIRALRDTGFEAGDYVRPARSGVVYMASDYNLTADDDGENKRRIAPHAMFYAPDLSNDDIGASPAEALANRGMPFIAGEGPMGFMISFVDHATDSADVIAACAGELPELADFAPFPPKP